VAVFGCGGVGLSAIQGARIAGADQIIAVDLQQSKLELARAVGATHTIDARQADVTEAVRQTPTTKASTMPSRRPAATRRSRWRGSHWRSAGW
jgi:Zn-dependent alcohol dehydrogenase